MDAFWKRKKKTMPERSAEQSSPPSATPSASPSIARVSPDYQPSTSSHADTQYFATTRELDAFVRSHCRFVDRMLGGMKLVGLDKKDRGFVYEVYQSDSLDTAMQFLESIPVTDIPSLYYVIVETPAGNVGKDLKGMFDE